MLYTKLDSANQSPNLVSLFTNVTHTIYSLQSNGISVSDQIYIPDEYLPSSAFTLPSLSYSTSLCHSPGIEQVSISSDCYSNSTSTVTKGLYIVLKRSHDFHVTSLDSSDTVVEEVSPFISTVPSEQIDPYVATLFFYLFMLLFTCLGFCL